MEFIMSYLPVLIYAAILALQYFLSRTRNKIIGLILPIVLIIVVIYMYNTGIIKLGIIPTLILTVIDLLFLLGQWLEAQKANEKKSENELENETKRFKLII
ncbi:hypothetical protein [Staphylococcus gallinarum]|uniref:hypothetical protein n=1 Tax=Staphylococcus gallinarum TaxID=1293 RepID=UPI000E692718|nr:hypothetical protein BUZ07_13645 [Staphylococcus gallinarum]